MEIIITIFIIFIFLNLIIALHPIGQKLRFTLKIWKRFRFVMFFEVIGLIIITIIVFALLYLFVPYMKYGWLNLFIKGGGTIAIAPVVEESKSNNLYIRIFPPIFFFIFLLALPTLAKIEEEVYRKGFVEWKDIFNQSVKFGFAHMIMGIPLAAAIALIISGLFYGYKYRNAYKHEYENMNTHFYEYRKTYNHFYEYKDSTENKAVIVSTTYHTMYNSILILSILILILVNA